MRKIFILSGFSTILFLGAFFSSSLLGLQALALAPLLLIVEEKQAPLYQKIVAGLIPFAVLSIALGIESLAILNFIAWTLYVLCRPLWGLQRALLGFVFLMLSAEALPFYTDVSPALNIALSEGFYQSEFWTPWLQQVSFLGLSLNLLILNLFFFFGLKQKEEGGNPALGLIFFILVLSLGPIIFCLTADATSTLNFPKHDVWELPGIDQFIARLSFFLAFFLLLFALVRKILPQKNGDNRFT